MNTLIASANLSARLDSLYDELDRYAVITDYDPDVDDLTREIAELRHALHQQ
jgi:hypothetical protein